METWLITIRQIDGDRWQYEVEVAGVSGQVISSGSGFWNPVDAAFAAGQTTARMSAGLKVQTDLVIRYEIPQGATRV